MSHHRVSEHNSNDSEANTDSASMPQPDITRTVTEIIEDLPNAWCEDCEHPRCLSNKKSAVHKLVTLFKSELTQAKAEWLKEVISKVPEKRKHTLKEDIELVGLSDASLIYNFDEGYNQCRQDILKALGELK